ncbi:hypothetical protein O181_128205 [Austropuccinia psidii MF-1]|uniref:Uncharacterized protein n=1 Tax=Austropuccinia psidii MF-1 TaxID=1389203 RepID=A0A9Q3KZS2_9BASI|nr:hypothetical protein [Austropuccinia psidii MF-1]
MDGSRYHSNLKSKHIKDWKNKKQGGKKGRRPSRFFQQTKAQPTSPRREEEQEKELEETILPKLQDSKNTQRFHGQFLKHAQNLDGIQ